MVVDKCFCLFCFFFCNIFLILNPVFRIHPFYSKFVHLITYLFVYLFIYFLSIKIIFFKFYIKPIFKFQKHSQNVNSLCYQTSLHGEVYSPSKGDYHINEMSKDNSVEVFCKSSEVVYSYTFISQVQCQKHCNKETCISRKTF